MIEMVWQEKKYYVTPHWNDVDMDKPLSEQEFVLIDEGPYECGPHTRGWALFKGIKYLVEFDITQQYRSAENGWPDVRLEVEGWPKNPVGYARVYKKKIEPSELESKCQN